MVSLIWYLPKKIENIPESNCALIQLYGKCITNIGHFDGGHKLKVDYIDPLEMSVWMNRQRWLIIVLG